MKIVNLAVHLGEILVVVVAMVLARTDAAMLRTSEQTPRGGIVQIMTTTRSSSSRSLSQQGIRLQPDKDKEEEADDAATSAECSGCDYRHDPTCRECLQREHLIVVCGSCFYSNECFAQQAGKDPRQCTIVGTDP